MLIEASAQHQHLRDLGSTKSGTDTITTLSQEKKSCYVRSTIQQKQGTLRFHLKKQKQAHFVFIFLKTETGHTKTEAATLI